MKASAEATPLIRELLLKVKRLAESGVAGERVAAERKLQMLLKKHGLTLDDLRSDEKTWCEFRVRGEFQWALFFQCYFKVCQIRNASYRNKGTHFAVLVTPVQREDLKACFGHFKPLLKAALNDFATAFYVKNGIVGPASDEPSEPMSPDELERLINLMRGINPQPWVKPLAQLQEAYA